MAKQEKISGIYLWTNIINDKKYVGCSVNIYARWDAHLETLKLGCTRKFYNALRKYGSENFKKEIIEVLPPIKKVLKEREDYYIDFYDSIKNGYNIEKQYNTITAHPDFERIRKQISDKAKLRKWINDGEKNITICPENLQDFLDKGWKLGRLKFTEKHRMELSNSHKGQTLTQKQKDAWCSGRPHTQETKDNMSKKLQGRYSLKWYIEKYGEIEGSKKYHIHHEKIANAWKNKIIVNNGMINKSIHKNELEQYVVNGWKRGRLWKNK